jgi:tetratricopeptide (TPR) repeat protein
LRRRSGLVAGFALALAFACSLATSAATADDLRTAAELFKTGERAYAHRQFRDAASAFEEANRRAPRASALYAAAVSWDEAGETARAADDFELALSMQQGSELDDESRQDARARLSRISPRIAVVELDGPRGAIVTVAHASRVALPTRIHLAPGSWVVNRDDLGGIPTLDLVVTAGETRHVTVPDRRSVDVAKPPARSSALRTVGWVSLGAAGVFAAGATVLGIATLNARDTFVESGSMDASARDRALLFRTMTNLAWGGAALTALAAIPLLLLTPRAQVGVGAAEMCASVSF